MDHTFDIYSRVISKTLISNDKSLHEPCLQIEIKSSDSTDHSILLTLRHNFKP